MIQMHDFNLYSHCRVSSNTKDDMFVGFRYQDGDYSIIFPVGYDIPREIKKLKKSVLLFLRTLGHSDSTKKEANNINDTYNNDYNFPLFSYMWILSDFITNGLYYEKDKIISNNNIGPTNWKKTIQLKQPVYSEDNFIYLDLLYNKSRVQDSPITEIEKYCLNVAKEYCFWYYGDISIPQSKFNEMHIKYMISLINKLIITSYNDRRKTLLKHLLNILKGLDSNNFRNQVFSYGTYDYNAIWETLIKKIFCNVDVTKYYPQGFYSLKSGASIPASKLRPDTIYYDKVSNKYYVLDAKYYGNPPNKPLENLPATDSIQKQITYGMYIEKKYNVDEKNIFNSFIIPYNKNNNILNENADIVYYGFAESDWMLGKSTYSKIAVILMDTKYTIETWKDKNELAFKMMINAIEKVRD